MQKQAWTWTTPHLPEPARMARWGHFGVPVLIFPTAGGDFEEIERFGLIAALEALIRDGRIKVYSIDGSAVRAWLSAATATSSRETQSRYDSFVYEDVLKRMRDDCQDPRMEPLLAGASLGASLAVGTLCRHPDSFRSAIALSGDFDMLSESDTNLTRIQLELLRQRSIYLGCGEGDYERPDDSRGLAGIFRSKAVPCRLDLWGPRRDHTWNTWREMLPRVLSEFL